MNETNTTKNSPKYIQTLAIITLASIVHWSILIFGIPILDSLPNWKYTLRYTPIDASWILIAIAATAFAAFISFSSLKTAHKLLLLILLGTTMQFSLAFSKGYGLDGIRARLLNAGHAEFTKFAVRQPNILNAARDYEEFAKDGRYNYIPSKPPGTLIFYTISGRIANFNKGDLTRDERADNLSTLASITWPVITYLVLIPLYLLGRILYDDTVAITACLLYLPIPSVNLMTAHTDQAIYPMLAIIPILLIVLAVQKESIWLALASGAAFYIAVYFSFGLAAIAFFYLLPFIIKFGSGWQKGFQVSSKLIGFTALSIAICDLLARIFLNYDILLRYTNAIQHHAAWRSWENNVETLLSASVTNITEFSVWIGIPLSIFLITATIHAIYQLAVNRTITTATIYPALLFGVFCFLLAFGKTKAEAARLWMFLIPAICLIVANFIHARALGGRNQKLLVLLLVAYQFTTTYLTLHYQDF